MDYKCLTCGSKHGEPTDNNSENWYWRIVENGRVGPFCSQPCSREFRLSSEPTFSLMEWERLHFLKWRVLTHQLHDGQVAEENQIAS